MEIGLLTSGVYACAVVAMILWAPRRSRGPEDHAPHAGYERLRDAPEEKPLRRSGSTPHNLSNDVNREAGRRCHIRRDIQREA
jgi:hypothetical protein